MAQITSAPDARKSPRLTSLLVLFPTPSYSYRDAREEPSEEELEARISVLPVVPLLLRCLTHLMENKFHLLII